MKIEIRHDILAQKIYETASLEDKARAKAARFIQERFRYYQSDSTLLLNDIELNYINPHIDKISLHADEQEFVTISQNTSKRLVRRRKIGNYLTVALGCSALFLGWGFYWRSHALEEERKSNAQMIQLYQLSEDVRRVRSVEDVQHIRHRAENIVHQQLTDKKTKSFLQNAGVLQEAESSTHHHATLESGWKWQQLSGSVLDENAVPIAFADIELAETHFKTDEKGHFQFPVLIDVHTTEEFIELKVSKNGYNPQKQHISLQHPPTNLTISLKK